MFLRDVSYNVSEKKRNDNMLLSMKYGKFYTWK